MSRTPVPAPTPPSRIRRRTAWWLALGAFLVLGGGAFLFLYLPSPSAAGQLSRLLTGLLRVPVSLSAIEPRPGGVVIRGLRIANPQGFPGAPLATAEAVTIIPRWLALLRGERDFRRIELDGVRLSLVRNREGKWNVAQLGKGVARRKPAPELRIGELVIRSGAVTAAGYAAEGIALRLRDFSTRGSVDSRLELAFSDPEGSRFRLAGRLRPGPTPDLDLTLTAPSVSLAPYGKMLRTRGFSLGGGTGSLQLAVSYAGGLLRTKGRAEARGVLVDTGAGRLSPLTGRVALAARYEPARAKARVESLQVDLADTLKLRATGNVSRLRTERRFAAELEVDELDLGRLSRLLPAALRRDTAVGGTLGGGRFRIAGNAQGITLLGGGVRLRDGSASRGGRTLFRGLAGTATLGRGDGGFVVQGKLTLPPQGGTVPLERLDLPFSLALTERFALRRAEAAPLVARVAGVPVSGRASFRPADPRPLSLSLATPPTPLTVLAPRLASFGIRPAGGTVALALHVTGRGAGAMEGEFSLGGNAVTGEVKGRAVSLRKGRLRAVFERKGGRVDASGECRFDGARIDGRAAEARFGWRLTDRTVTLSDALFRLAGTTLEPGSLSLTAGAAAKRYPVTLTLAGGRLRGEWGEVAGLAAAFRGNFHGTPQGRWLEGSGVVTTGAATLRGAPLGAPSVRVGLGRDAATAELGGTVAGGALSGRLSFDPHAVARGVAFTVALRDGELAMLPPLLPGRPAVVPADGRVTIAAEGTFVPGSGVTCRVEGDARGVALARGEGKRLLQGAGARLSAAIAGEKATIRDAAFLPGPGVALRLRGAVDHAWSPRRQGELSLSLSRTPVADIVDPLANALPRLLQEATVGGAVTARATLSLKGGTALAEGAVTLDGVSLDVASQRLTVSGVGGTVPFSLLFGPGTPRRTPEAHRFTKENYPRLLATLRKTPAGGEVLTIGAVRFGPLELGETVLHLRAARGVTELSALRSSLYEGALLGKGFVAVQGGLAYGADILVNDLSLRRLCAAFPKIKGYASGRIDGVVSLYGEGKGEEGLVGFTDLWARESGGEKMLLSKEFLQRLAGKKLRGFFFRDDRPYDTGEISAYLEKGYLTFTTLDISHTNFLGIRDLSVSVAPLQNRIALDHLFGAIREAAARGKAVRAGEPPAEAPLPQTEFMWQE
ncbi:hypothetical protein [Geobacter sp.]|uniref:DUF748 domain-containing protein n=1 Tax=Geobacter sp. TaxID=46610 RepID=UPI002607DED9|nr:hypothetical protein [Geobacter sp.]